MVFCFGKTQRIIKLIIVLIFSIPLIVGCLGNRVQNLSIDQVPLSIQEYEQINPQTISYIKELMVLSIDEPSGPIVISRYFPTSHRLLAIYLGDGYLRSWDIDTENILFEHYLGISSFEGANFDGSGNLVMGAKRSEL